MFAINISAFFYKDIELKKALKAGINEQQVMVNKQHR